MVNIARSGEAQSWADLIAIARQLYAAGRTGECETLLRQASTRHAGQLAALLKLSETRRQLGLAAVAVAIARRAVKLAPQEALSHYCLGAALAAAQSYREAAGAFRRSIIKHPDFVEAHSNLGAVLHALGQFAEAVAALSTAVR